MHFALLLRVAILGLGVIWILSGGVRMLRNGKGELRGGTVVSRRRNPGLFWTSIGVQFAVAAMALYVLWGIIVEGR